MAEVSQRTIKARAERGLTGAELIAPVKPGNFKIDENKALAIWKDIQRLVKKHKPKTVDITGMVAAKHGVSKTLVTNIRSGRSWNSVTGLPKREYER